MSYEENSDNEFFQNKEPDFNETADNSKPSLDSEPALETAHTNDGFYAYKKPESNLEDTEQHSYGAYGHREESAAEQQYRAGSTTGQSYDSYGQQMAGNSSGQSYDSYSTRSQNGSTTAQTYNSYGQQSENHPGYQQSPGTSQQSYGSNNRETGNLRSGQSGDGSSSERTGGANVQHHSDGSNSNSQGSCGKHKKSGSRLPAWLRVVIFAVIFGLVAALVFQGVTVGIFGSSSKSDSGTNDETSAIEQEEEEEEIPEINITESQGTSSVTSSVADIVEKCMPSVVSVATLSVQQVRDWFGGIQEYEVEGGASGIIVGKSDTELLIVTNNHVVSGAQELTVSFIDEKSASATVKGTNAEKDVAVMAVSMDDLDESTLQAISIATLGDSDTLRVGEDAIIIGNAMGYGQSVTKGIISALDREFVYDDYGINCNMIQTDAAINPGNSGGALLNANGEVVGISDAKDVDVEVESICYAIPISSVKELITEFMNRETRNKVDEDERGILGIRGTSIDSQQAEVLNMPEGIYVSETVQGLGAAKAGIIQGDIIVSADGQQVKTLDDLSEVLSYFKIGEEVDVTIERLTKEGEYESIELKIEVSKYSE